MIKNLVRTIAICVVMLFGEGVANCQDIGTKPKTTGRALALSLGGTLIPAACGALSLKVAADRGVYDSPLLMVGYVTGAAGLVFGPGTGHWYAGDQERFWVGAGLRSLCGLAFLYGAAGVGDDEHAHSLEAESLIGGALGMLALSVYDIATVGQSVSKHNQQEAQAGISISLAPELLRRRMMLGFRIAL